MTSLLMLMTAFLSPMTTDVDEFLEDLAEARKGLHVLEAPFTMTNLTPEERMTTEGELVYAKPRRIVFRLYDEFTEEIDMVMLIDHARLFEYDAALAQLQTYHRRDATDMQALFAAFESDPADLRDAYEIELFEPGDEAHRAAIGVLLRPRETDEGTLFERVRLYLREGDLLPTRIHIINDPTSEVFLDFHHYVVNREIDPRITQIEIPPGTRVIEDDQRVYTVKDDTEWMPEPIVPDDDAVTEEGTRLDIEPRNIPFPEITGEELMWP